MKIGAAHPEPDQWHGDVPSCFCPGQCVGVRAELVDRNHRTCLLAAFSMAVRAVGLEDAFAFLNKLMIQRHGIKGERNFLPRVIKGLDLRLCQRGLRMWIGGVAAQSGVENDLVRMIGKFLPRVPHQVEFIEQVVRPLQPGGGLHLRQDLIRVETRILRAVLQKLPQAIRS